MAHTYTSLLTHCVFSTKERRRMIPEELQPRLWSYMGGIARTNKIKALAIGGTDDHVHMLVSLPSHISVAKAMQLVKAGSSKWMHDELGKKLFSWQESYGAFSIGITQIPATVKYINSQKEHHQRRTFDEELVLILKKHGIVPD
jgi:putative transposase